MKIQFEGGQTVEFQGNPTPKDIEEVAKSLSVKPVESLVPQGDSRDTSIMENIFKVPSAAVRSFIQGTGYQHGAQDFRHIPTFQDLAIKGVNENIDKFDPQAGVGKRFVLGLPASVAGLAADVATDPASSLMMLAGKAPAGAGKSVEEVLKDFPIVKKAGAAMNYPLENIPGDIKKGAMSLFTKDPQLAENFVKNPASYDINPFSKVPNFEREKSSHSAYMQNFREDKKREMEDSVEQSRLAIADLGESFKLERQAAMSDNAQHLQEASGLADQQLAKVQESIQNRLMGAYEGALKTVDALYTDIGQGVEKSIGGILGKNPEATLPHKTVFEPFNELVQKASQESRIPFDVAVTENGGLEIAGKTAVTDPADVDFFAKVWKEMNPVNQTSGYRIDKLQILKSQLQEKASQYFNEGKGKLGQFYSDVSKIVNPANAISSNPELSAALPELKASNQAYHEFKPAYEEMLSLYTKPDANGKPVPDFRKVWNAIENNDVPTLNRIKQAESALPEADRLFPKVQQAVSDSNVAKKLATDELKKTQTQLGMQLKDLDSAHREILTSERAAGRDSKLQMARQIRESLVAEQRKIQAHLDFIQDQENLRKLPAILAGNAVKAADAVAGPFKVPAQGFKGLVEGLSSVVKNRPAGVAVGAGTADALGRQGK